MSRGVVIALGVVAGVAAYASLRRGSVTPGNSIENAFIEGMDYMNSTAGKLADTFGFIKVANMGAVDRSLVNHPNVRAMLRVIRQGESSQDDSIAYRMIVGRVGIAFTSFADHPRIFGTRTSTAAGAYQITKTTWDETRAKMGLPDFSPPSQDLAALGRIAYRGALPAVLAGDLDTAIRKLRNEWTSLPGAAENNAAAGGMDKARRVFLSWGGTLGGPVYA